MADFRVPSDEEQESWARWADDRPPVIQHLAAAFKPWKLYRLITTGHRVILYSFYEDGTLCVAVLAKYNLVRFERRVFGINPLDLEECELPVPGEVLGVTLTEAEQLAYINERRAENGLAALTEAELTEMSMDERCAMDDTDDVKVRPTEGDIHG